MPTLPDPPAERPGAEKRRFKVTLIRVMAVQVVTLILFWILQSRYNG